MHFSNKKNGAIIEAVKKQNLSAIILEIIDNFSNPEQLASTLNQIDPFTLKTAADIAFEKAESFRTIKASNNYDESAVDHLAKAKADIILATLLHFRANVSLVAKNKQEIIEMQYKFREYLYIFTNILDGKIGEYGQYALHKHTHLHASWEKYVQIELLDTNSFVKQLQKNAALRNRKKYTCQVANSLLNNLDNIEGITTWYIKCVFFSDELRTRLYNKKPHEIVAEFILKSKVSNHALYEQWTMAINNNITLIEKLSLTLHHEIKIFLYSKNKETPEINLHQLLLHNEDEEVKRKKKKKKKKNKSNNKKNTIKTTEIPNLAIMIDMAISDKKQNKPEEKCAEKNLRELILINEEFFEKKTTLIRFAEHPLIACKTFLELLNSIQEVVHGKYILTQCSDLILSQNLTLNLTPQKYQLMLTPSEAQKHFNLVIKELLIKIESRLNTKKNNSSKSKIRQFANLACELLKINPALVPELVQIHMNSLTKLKSLYPNITFHLTGSLATRFVEHSFGLQDSIAIENDIDLACFMNAELEEPTWILANKILTIFSTSNDYKVLQQHTSPTINDSFACSFKLDHKGILIDLIIYTNPESRRRPVDSYKSFIIDLESGKLNCGCGLLLNLINGVRTFDHTAFIIPKSLAYMLRELARMNGTLKLTSSSNDKWQRFMNDPNNAQIIRQAVGLYLAKYTEYIDSIYYHFFITNKLYKYFPDLNDIYSIKSATLFVEQITTHLTLMKNNFSLKKNLFPIIYLTAIYFYKLNISLNLEKINKIAQRITDTLFPKSVISHVISLLTAISLLRQEIPTPNPLALAFYNKVSLNHPWLLGYSTHKNMLTFRKQSNSYEEKENLINGV